MRKLVLAYLIGLLIIIGCGDLAPIGLEGDTRIYVFLCQVRDTLHVGADSMTVVCGSDTLTVGLGVVFVD